MKTACHTLMTYRPTTVRAVRAFAMTAAVEANAASTQAWLEGVDSKFHGLGKSIAHAQRLKEPST